MVEAVLGNERIFRAAVDAADIQIAAIGDPGHELFVAVLGGYHGRNQGPARRTASQRRHVVLADADVLAAFFLGLLGRFFLLVFRHFRGVGIDLAELLGRVGDRLQAIGEDHAGDHRHIGPLAAQRRAAAGGAVDRGLVQDIARIAVHHVERGAVDRGHQVATGAGGKAGMVGLPDHFRPELLARLRVDRFQGRAVRLGVEHAVVKHDRLQSALAAVDLGLRDPYTGQAAALGRGFGNNFIVQSGRQLPGRGQQRSPRRDQQEMSHRRSPTCFGWKFCLVGWDQIA